MCVLNVIPGSRVSGGLCAFRHVCSSTQYVHSIRPGRTQPPRQEWHFLDFDLQHADLLLVSLLVRKLPLALQGAPAALYVTPLTALGLDLHLDNN